MFMKSNVGQIDRIIRVILSIVIFYAYCIGWITGLLALAAPIFSFVLAVTALTGDCFLYDWIKMGTKIK
jgi:hypothetical protein